LMMTAADKTPDVKSDHDERLKVDAGGTIKALQFGTYGTLAAGVVGAAAAANALPLIVIGAVPLVGGLGSALYGYLSAKDVNFGRPKPPASAPKVERDV